jgi:hypothetical protein
MLFSRLSAGDKQFAAEEPSRFLRGSPTDGRLLLS